MRGAGFGLLGLLMVVAIIFWVSFGPMGKGANKGYVGATTQAAGVAREQATEISGRDENGVPAADSIKVEPVEAGGQFRRVKVVSLVPGGPFEKVFQLQAGDEITEVGGLGVDLNDFQMAEARVQEAIQLSEPMTVLRNGQKLVLTPDTAISRNHPELFGKGGTRAIPTH